MSHAVYVISDSHFGHANILNFRRPSDGKPLRTFQNVDEMNEHMIEKWNSVVRPQDHVYHLGDFAMRQQDVKIACRLNGHKRLVRGNHDKFKTRMYIEYGFTEIYGVRIINELMLTHIPAHPDTIRRAWVNVHGHIHNNDADGPRTPRLGDRYYNASVECLDYTPRTLEQIKAEIASWV